jgi:flagellar hook-associated protein 1 FlgK
MPEDDVMAMQSIGLAGLDVSQRLLDIAGQNIANAGTPGFHRQVADLVDRSLETGGGVDIAQVRRVVNQALETALTGSTYDLNQLATQLDGMRQVQNTVLTGDGSIGDLLTTFFNQVQQLAAQPDDPTQRQVVVSTASALTGRINDMANSIDALRANLQQQIPGVVAQINSLSTQIASENQNIQRISLQGGNVNELLDQRDQDINKLAELIDVRVVPQDNGVVNVMAAGAAVVLGTNALALQTAMAGDQTTVTTGLSATPLNVSGGQLGGLLQLRNVDVAGIHARLDELAHTLATSVDALQSTGVGLWGPFTQLNGSRAVERVNAPLAQAGLALPPNAGSLFISVTNQATGQRVLNKVNIDPATQSLQDVANAISSVANVQAVVDTQNRTLVIMARPGYAFDFAGRLATDPTSQAITGTASPQIDGTYTGSANDTYTYKVVGSGTVGVTPGLTLEARNSAGALLATWNIGQGYEPGSELPALNGVTVKMAAGTANAGDIFSATVVAQPDTAGLLTALGLNTFFTGDSASNLGVSPDLVENPENLSAGLSGLPGDNANLLRWNALRDAPLLAGGTQTFNEFYARLAADVGSRVQDLDQRHSAQSDLKQRLQAQQQSISGVDPNEELVKLLQFQRSFQMSAKFLTVVNETLAELFQLV